MWLNFSIVFTYHNNQNVYDIKIIIIEDNAIMIMIDIELIDNDNTNGVVTDSGMMIRDH